ncbi:hypothetical protein [Peribacillus frigoritolerans]|nr:hypothetical protein [Peribacillus frigoritolerans]
MNLAEEGLQAALLPFEKKKNWVTWLQSAKKSGTDWSGPTDK